MPTTRDDDDDDDELDLIEGDWDDDFDDDTVRCPHCRRGISEDAIRCPYCENYLSDIDASLTKKPLWFVIGFCLTLYIVYRWIVRA